MLIKVINNINNGILQEISFSVISSSAASISILSFCYPKGITEHV